MPIGLAATSLLAMLHMSTVVQTALPKDAATPKPTIILVHGPFAESSSWNGVVADLTRDGYRGRCGKPAAGRQRDAGYVASLVASVSGPVVLVGHSYGGEVISVAAAGRSNVKALVFVAGLAPEVGESAVSLGNKFPTGTLGQTFAPPVALSDGNKDLYIDQARYWRQFAADVPEPDAIGMAATRRPITHSALGEPVAALSWRDHPSWFVWGSLDKNIPAALHAFMAKRANAREAIEIPGASHVVMVSHADAVAALIERAAQAH